ncbi:MAG: iron chelate uptake ABC transporter family permease subunit, partial [Caulobacteraceae bacterium]|nr:iron chelate uptake ABC transporter family permease subunit [Caulobacter sp.]
LIAPSTLGLWRDGAALAGGLGAVGLALLVAAPWRFAPAAVILAGLAIGLFCGAAGHALKLFNQEYLSSVLLWNAGALGQDDWSVVRALLPRLAGLALATALLLRPLTLLGFGEGARGLGLPAGPFRLAALAVAVGFAAVVTASVGGIGFVEIAAPLVARLAGARRLGTRLVVAPVIGAAMLVIVDTAVQGLNARFDMALPTGAVTSLLAAPLLLWLAPRMRPDPTAAAADWGLGAVRRKAAPLLFGLAAAVVVAAAASCLLGPAGFGASAVALPWRLPRMAEAGAAGAMLAVAGGILQRATGNLLASPEVLGLGAAVMAGFAAVLFLGPAPTGPALVTAGASAAALLVLALLGGTWRSRLAPEQLILTGVALTAAIDAALVVCLSSEDPRAALLLGWMAGSTAGAEPGGAVALCATAAALIPLCFAFTRSLALLPLGAAAARGLGLPLGPARAALMGLAALLTATAVLAVGPLSFVGLVGPHLARRLGLHGPAAELAGAALLGALIMVLADWVGRVACAPFELPAGLVAALIGCPYLLFQLRRRG